MISPTKKLSDVCKINMGQSPTSSTYNEEQIGLPFYQGKKDYGEIYPTPRIWCSNPLKIVERGDILISVRAPVGSLNIANEKSCIGRGLAGIRAEENILDQRYLYKFLKLKEKEISNKGTGSTFASISKKDIAEVEIPLPPLEEQKRIVKMLDEKMGKIGEAKRLRAEALADTEKILPATLHEIFEEGKKNGWVEKKVSDIAEIKGGKRLPKGDKLIDEKTAHPYLRVTDFKNGILNVRGVKFLNETTFEQIFKYTISSEDIFVSIAGTIGLVCIIPREFDGASLTENAAKITNIDKSIDKNFLFWQLQTLSIQKEFVGKAIQTTISKLALHKIANQKILIPPLAEQQKIVAKLDALSEKVRTLRTLQTAQLADLKSLERAHLREAFAEKLI